MKRKLSCSGFILKTEATYSSETLISTYKTVVGFVTITSVSNEIEIVVFRINPEDGGGMFHCNSGVHLQRIRFHTLPCRPKSGHAPL
jgi:hypothetical protein